MQSPHHMIRSNIRLLGCFLGLVILSGCGWVDSTGTQTNELPVIEVLFDDGSPFTVATVPEQQALLVTSTASDRDGVISTWRWSDQPSAQGSGLACSAGSEFNSALAVETLAEACEIEGCGISFEQREILGDDGETVTVSGALDSSVSSTVQFIAVMPAVKAPVAVSYNLAASDNKGGRAFTEHTFCINSENSAPVATNDVFTMLESDILQPTLQDRHLLSNDTDDDDVRNQPLQVSVIPVRAPSQAADFELFTDGTFRYQFAGPRLDTDIEDSFEYEITDGTFPVTAMATVRIVAIDDPPEIVAPFPNLVGIIGIEVSDDFNQNVVDPEGATLTFTAGRATLPASGDVVVSRDGILEGTPTPEDLGVYSIDVQASDGSETFDFSVPFTVIANAPVESRDIQRQTAIVSRRFSIITSVYFSDPESQPIQYELELEDSDVDLTISNNSGFVTGFVREPGIYRVTIIATDGVSIPSRETFQLTVLPDNQAPVFDEPNIGSETLRRNRFIAPIAANFSDPDDDELEYTMQGSLPPGLTLSTDGVISGRPTSRGDYLGLRVIATDERGLTARSNTFSLFVR